MQPFLLNSLLSGSESQQCPAWRDFRVLFWGDSLQVLQRNPSPGSRFNFKYLNSSRCTWCCCATSVPCLCVSVSLMGTALIALPGLAGALRPVLRSEPFGCDPYVPAYVTFLWRLLSVRRTSREKEVAEKQDNQNSFSARFCRTAFQLFCKSQYLTTFSPISGLECVNECIYGKELEAYSITFETLVILLFFCLFFFQSI